MRRIARIAGASSLVVFVVWLLAGPLALAAISGYQRWISPHKGFRCAHAALWPGETCSAHAASVIRARGVVEGVFLMQARFQACEAAQRLIERRSDGTWQCQGNGCAGSGTWKCG